MPKVNVLYIEDEREQLDALSKALAQQGFAVHTAGSGDQGLQKLRKNGRMEVVLCDLNMPGMDGLQVLKAIKASSPSLPVIITTAHGNVEKAVKALKMGASDFVLKPPEIHKLTAAIHKAIENRDLQRRLHEFEWSLATLTANVPDLIYSLDQKGDFLNVSPAVEPLLGYRREELIGESVFKLIYADDLERVRTGFNRIMDEGDKEIHTLQFRMSTKQGEVKHFEVNRRLIFENGSVIRQDGIARDITERKKLEDKLQNYSQELEREVQERTEKLEYATRQLAALNAVSNRFSLIYSEKELLNEVPHLICHTLDFDRASLMLYKRGKLRLRSFCLEKDSRDVVLHFLRRVRSRDAKIPPHFLESYHENKTIFIRDLNADKRWPREPGEEIRTKAVVVTPIKVKKKPQGVLIANMQHHDRDMDEQDVARFEMFANMVGLALENVRAYQALESKVVERTKALRQANAQMRQKAKELEQQTYDLARANVELLSVQEEIEHKNAETERLLQDVSESKNRLEAILDSSLSAVIMVDHTGQVIAANLRVKQFFALKPAEIVNHPFTAFIERVTENFADLKEFRKHLKKIRYSDDDTPEIEIHCVKPVERLLAVYCTPVLDKQGDELGAIWSFTDITERKRAEEAIRESEEKFRQLTENIQEVFWLVDLELNKMIYVSPSYRDIFGKEPDELYENTDAWLKSVHPDDLEVLSSEMAKQRGSGNEQEFRIIRPDGSVRWIRSRAFPIHDDNGEVYRFCGVSEDVTERKLARAALEESEAKNSALLNAIPDLMFQLSSDARILDYKKAIDVGLYADPENFLDKHVSEVFPAEFAHDTQTHIDKALTTSDIQIFEYQLPLGEELRDYEARMVASGLERVLVIVRDITVRKKAERALRDSEARFRNLVENAHDIIFSLTLDGNFIYISPNWQRMLGHAVEEAIGQPFEKYVHPDDVAACREFIAKTVRTGGEAGSIEYRVRHKDESWRWYSTNASPFRDTGGEVQYYIGIAQDITERRKMLDDLEKANRHLVQTQSQLVQSEKMASLGMLVAGIAHEINTPVGAISSMHDTLKRAVVKLRTTLEEQYPQELESNKGLSASMKVIEEANRVIDSGAERVTTIVRRLRSFARLDEAELKTVDIHDGLEDTLTLIHHEIKHNITVVKNYGEIQPFACYPGRLNQVFLNLFINARQAMAKNGVLTITTYQKQEQVYIEISDNGSGIPAEKLKNIFDPGFTTKGVGVGTGLGLSIVYQIIEDHRGEIKVESKVGKGTTFTIMLPTNLNERLEKDLRQKTSAASS